MKKLFKFSMMCLMASPFFTGCGKDSETNGNGGNTEPTQQRTEEFIYNSNLEFFRSTNSTKIPHDAFADTVEKFATEQIVKQIHITPQSQYMCETSTETGMVGRANDFENLYNVSNNKLSGENTTLVLEASAFANQTVQQILNGKLKITLVEREH